MPDELSASNDNANDSLVVQEAPVKASIPNPDRVYRDAQENLASLRAELERARALLASLDAERSGGNRPSVTSDVP